MTSEEFLKEWHCESPHFRANTSGSTGVAKSILLHKNDAVLSARATNRFFNLEKGARFVCPMDFKYIGAKMMAVRAEVCGGELIAPEPSNRFSFEGHADLLAVVPSQIRTLIDLNPMLLERTRNIIIGGAPLSPELAGRIKATNVNAFTTYGMTETCSHVALAPVGEETYTAMPGISFDIDTRGCLVVRMPERTLSEVVTNDVIELVNNQQFKWLGRYDNIVNSGGVKLNPEKIADHLRFRLNFNRIIASDVVCLGIPSAALGEQLVGVIESASEISQCCLDEILEEMKTLAPSPYAWPRKIVVLNRIPRTPNHKIDYSKLRQILLNKNLAKP